MPFHHKSLRRIWPLALGPKLLDLPDQLVIRMLDVNHVDALGGLDPSCTPLARLVAITLRSVSLGALRA